MLLLVLRWPIVAGRFAPVVGPISGHAGSAYAVYFPAGSGMTYALDAHDGKLLWKTKIEGLLHISNSAALYDGRLFVPIAGTETFAGTNPDYECCSSRGGVAAFDANTGKMLWKVDSIPEPLRSLGENSRGKQRWGPAGASVWNTPTIDAKRKRIYVGTGNSYGVIAADTSDSILALNMDDGKLLWSHQEFKGDSFMVGCGPTNPADGNCPRQVGPRLGLRRDRPRSCSIFPMAATFCWRQVKAASPWLWIRMTTEKCYGERNSGKERRLRRTAWWSSVEPRTASASIILCSGPGGGLKALEIDSGKVDWTAEIKADQRGQIGAASSIPGIVFTGAWDGILRAVDADGKVIWSYDTHRDFETVNGVRANGGSLGSPGPTIVNGMVYVSSGYVGVQNGFPGNVVLAFGAE